jgi:hypothetical protein
VTTLIVTAQHVLALNMIGTRKMSKKRTRPGFLTWAVGKILRLNYRTNPESPDWDDVPDILSMYFAEFPERNWRD